MQGVWPQNSPAPRRPWSRKVARARGTTPHPLNSRSTRPDPVLAEPRRLTLQPPPLPPRSTATKTQLPRRSYDAANASPALTRAPHATYVELANGLEPSTFSLGSRMPRCGQDVLSCTYSGQDGRSCPRAHGQDVLPCTWRGANNRCQVPSHQAEQPRPVKRSSAGGPSPHDVPAPPQAARRRYYYCAAKIDDSGRLGPPTAGLRSPPKRAGDLAHI